MNPKLKGYGWGNITFFGATAALPGGLVGDVGGVEVFGVEGFFNSGGDRLFLKMGPAKLSHPQEYQMILNDLKANSVDISFRKDQFAYGPASMPGKPGNIVLSPDVSISALRHEYGHFLDDKALGYPGMRAYYENPSLRVATERRQYLEEIRLARVVGDTVARRQLIMDYLEERSMLIDHFYIEPYGYMRAK